MSTKEVPKLGPEPTLLSRKEIDVLYETLDVILNALRTLKVDAIVTGGSLLGAIRQHSILFCDDDIDLTIIDYDGTVYEDIVKPNLQDKLGGDHLYQVRPWEGGDRIRPKRMSNVFVDLFVLRKYECIEDLKSVIGIKKNGQPQSEGYVDGIVQKLQDAAVSQDEATPLCPFWHFSTRKAVEMWTKEVYRHNELFPLQRDLKMGPVTGVVGPRMPVKLLRRAFGADCFEVFFQSLSHRGNKNGCDTSIQHHQEQYTPGEAKEKLPPLVAAGGTWEAGVKTPLEDRHYLPMQPLARKARRPTLHNKATLFHYLGEQSKQEEEWSRDGQSSDPVERLSRTVYMDGVFDLFHIGHLEAIRQCAKLGNRVIIGVTGDEDAEGYKRLPIVPQVERAAIIHALQEVDQVVCPCPLVVTEDFMTELGIDLVVHGFANDADAARQEEFFAIPAKMGKFRRISYYHGLSTTERIQNIQSSIVEDNGTEAANAKPNWFGATLATATGSVIPHDPFPINLRQLIEPHILKARRKRENALKAIQTVTEETIYQSVWTQFHRGLVQEGSFEFDTQRFMMRESFLRAVNFPTDFDLSRLHEEKAQKLQLLRQFTKDAHIFQDAFDLLVRNVCAPHFASIHPCDEIYYQAFPCIRIVQPGEFSIGPHSDVAYGHHPCSVNYYLPLTRIGGAASVFLESRPGAEDWHPIEGEYGRLKHFAGGICLHWTTESKTDYTRVSLDFRLIAGHMFDALKCGASVPGGTRDVYRESSGYYSKCQAVAKNGEVEWQRQGPLLAPDARMGLPWTVKDWDKHMKKNDS